MNGVVKGSGRPPDAGDHVEVVERFPIFDWNVEEDVVEVVCVERLEDDVGLDVRGLDARDVGVDGFER